MLMACSTQRQPFQAMGNKTNSKNTCRHAVRNCNGNNHPTANKFTELNIGPCHVEHNDYIYSPKISPLLAYSVTR